MRVWILGEIVCSGKLDEVRLCKKRFGAKLQLEMAHSNIQPLEATVVDVEGGAPDGWKMVKKEYYAIPHYFCKDCEAYCKDFEKRPY